MGKTDDDAISGISHNLRQIDVRDREERKEANRRQQALAPRWLDELGPAPVLKPGDHDGARARFMKIAQLIARGGWTIDERNRLKRMKRKWLKKAEGKDMWFEANGNPATHTGANIKYGHEGWKQRNEYEWKKVRKPPIF